MKTKKPNPIISCACGCGATFLQRTANSQLRTRLRGHGRHSGHGLSKTSLYSTWNGMRARCNNPKANNYHLYGARGIKVCERWSVFQNFADDMGPKPSPRHTLDRQDNAGNYEPSNVRWALPSEQNKNRSVTRYLTYHGRTMAIFEWASLLRIPRTRIIMRLRRGRTTEEALTVGYLPKGPVPKSRQIKEVHVEAPKDQEAEGALPPLQD